MLRWTLLAAFLSGLGLALAFWRLLPSRPMTGEPGPEVVAILTHVEEPRFGRLPQPLRGLSDRIRRVYVKMHWTLHYPLSSRGQHLVTTGHLGAESCLRESVEPGATVLIRTVHAKDKLVLRDCRVIALSATRMRRFPDAAEHVASGCAWPSDALVAILGPLDAARALHFMHAIDAAVRRHHYGVVSATDSEMDRGPQYWWDATNRQIDPGRHYLSVEVQSPKGVADEERFASILREVRVPPGTQIEHASVFSLVWEDDRAYEFQPGRPGVSSRLRQRPN